MITLFPTDGLGNQMFQYAFARALQIHTKNKLRFSVDKFKNDQSNRAYGLSNLCIDEGVKILSDKAGKYAHFEFKIMNHLRLLGKNETKRYMGKKIIYALYGDVYDYVDYKKIKFSRNIWIMGHFQSPKYFEDYSDVIKKELKVKPAPSAQNEEKISEIRSVNSVCVHVRRGDYLDPKWKALNICDYDYYRKSMDFIAKKIENPVFYIFSNSHEDIEWIKQNYDFSNFNVEYVDLDNPDYEELRLMYSCKHFIISNSTFSWWAQYLGEDEGKVVVAPSKWNREGVNYSDLYMSEWETVEVN